MENLTTLKQPSEKMFQKTPGEAFIEVHKRIRPGDLATEDNARGFLKQCFL